MANDVIDADPNDKIVITIHESAERDGLIVRSIELFVSAMKIRFSAHQSNTVEDVFQDDISGLLRSICASAESAKQIINVPDFCLRLRGLAIDGYTLLVHTMENGMRQFIVRMRRAVGNALALFKVSSGTDSGLSLFTSKLVGSSAHDLQPDRLFDEMLSHVYLPLVNLNNYLKDVLDGKQACQTNGLGGSIVQLKTKAEVLQFAFDRLISEMTVTQFAAPKLVHGQVLEHDRSDRQKSV
ncbi:MAG: hypothetical protein AAF666_13120 [Pseudomonadota bacterium]